MVHLSHTDALEHAYTRNLNVETPGQSQSAPGPDQSRVVCSAMMFHLRTWGRLRVAFARWRASPSPVRQPLPRRFLLDHSDERWTGEGNAAASVAGGGGYDGRPGHVWFSNQSYARFPQRSFFRARAPNT